MLPLTAAVSFNGVFWVLIDGVISNAVALSNCSSTHFSQHGLRGVRVRLVACDAAIGLGPMSEAREDV